ncbi:hypothetical protein ACFFJI_07365 [Allobacillus sp. GCM10007491]|nr:hypothetical protein [Allobacillus saliphilus]
MKKQIIKEDHVRKELLLKSLGRLERELTILENRFFSKAQVKK